MNRTAVKQVAAESDIQSVAGTLEVSQGKYIGKSLRGVKVSAVTGVDNGDRRIKDLGPAQAASASPRRIRW